MPSPFAPPAVNGIAAHPSPVKKKMSLSDYKSRMNKLPVKGPTLLTKPTSPNGENNVPESPIVEKAELPIPTTAGTQPPT
jgi:uncharacterized protein